MASENKRPVRSEFPQGRRGTKQFEDALSAYNKAFSADSDARSAAAKAAALKDEAQAETIRAEAAARKLEAEAKAESDRIAREAKQAEEAEKARKRKELQDYQASGLGQTLGVIKSGPAFVGGMLAGGLEGQAMNRLTRKAGTFFPRDTTAGRLGNAGITLSPYAAASGIGVVKGNELMRQSEDPDKTPWEADTAEATANFLYGQGAGNATTGLYFAANPPKSPTADLEDRASRRDYMRSLRPPADDAVPQNRLQQPAELPAPKAEPTPDTAVGRGARVTTLISALDTRQLQETARRMGVDVNSKMTNTQLAEAIVNRQDEVGPRNTTRRIGKSTGRAGKALGLGGIALSGALGYDAASNAAEAAGADDAKTRNMGLAGAAAGAGTAGASYLGLNALMKAAPKVAAFAVPGMNVLGGAALAAEALPAMLEADRSRNMVPRGTGLQEYGDDMVRPTRTMDQPLPQAQMPLSQGNIRIPMDRVGDQDRMALQRAAGRVDMPQPEAQQEPEDFDMMLEDLKAILAQAGMSAEPQRASQPIVLEPMAPPPPYMQNRLMAAR